jgi:hypothetical protein
MNIRPWQRQPGESPADFMLFAAYLRLKGRRSSRAVAAQTGRSLGTIRRLSAQYKWPARVAAFEVRLADATQDALDAVLRRKPADARDELEQLRIKEFLLAHQVIHASHRWLGLASNPRRHQISLTQICRLVELAFKLKCLATGMPFDQKPRRLRKEDRPGYWTGPTAEEALKKIYGDDSDPSSAPPDAVEAGGRPQGHPGSPSASGDSGEASVPASRPSTTSPPLPPADIPRQPVDCQQGGRPQGPRCDTWSRQARYLRRMKS